MTNTNKEEKEKCIVEEYCNYYTSNKHYESFLLKLIIVIGIACLPLLTIFYCIMFVINEICIHFVDKARKNE